MRLGDLIEPHLAAARCGARVQVFDLRARNARAGGGGGRSRRALLRNALATVLLEPPPAAPAFLSPPCRTLTAGPDGRQTASDDRPPPHGRKRRKAAGSAASAPHCASFDARIVCAKRGQTGGRPWLTTRPVKFRPSSITTSTLSTPRISSSSSGFLATTPSSSTASRLIAG